MIEEPFRLRALLALTDALKDITPAAGYRFDLADFDPGDGAMQARVFRGRPWFGDSDPIPMLSILEAVDFFDDIMVQQPVDNPAGLYDWQLIVQGFVNDDPANPTDPAYRLLADVRKRLRVEKVRRATGLAGREQPDPLGSRTWAPPGCRVDGLLYGLGNVRPADDVSAKAYFTLMVTLRVTEADA